MGTTATAALGGKIPAPYAPKATEAFKTAGQAAGFSEAEIQAIQQAYIAARKKTTAAATNEGLSTEQIAAATAEKNQALRKQIIKLQRELGINPLPQDESATVEQLSLKQQELLNLRRARNEAAKAEKVLADKAAAEEAKRASYIAGAGNRPDAAGRYRDDKNRFAPPPTATPLLRSDAATQASQAATDRQIAVAFGKAKQEAYYEQIKYNKAFAADLAQEKALREARLGIEQADLQAALDRKLAGGGTLRDSVIGGKVAQAKGTAIEAAGVGSALAADPVYLANKAAASAAHAKEAASVSAANAGDPLYIASKAASATAHAVEASKVAILNANDPLYIQSKAISATAHALEASKVATLSANDPLYLSSKAAASAAHAQEAASVAKSNANDPLYIQSKAISAAAHAQEAASVATASSLDPLYIQSKAVSATAHAVEASKVAILSANDPTLIAAKAAAAIAHAEEASKVALLTANDPLLIASKAATATASAQEAAKIAELNANNNQYIAAKASAAKSTLIEAANIAEQNALDPEYTAAKVRAATAHNQEAAAVLQGQAADPAYIASKLAVAEARIAERAAIVAGTTQESIVTKAKVIADEKIIQTKLKTAEIQALNNQAALKVEGERRAAAQMYAKALNQATANALQAKGAGRFEVAQAASGGAGGRAGGSDAAGMLSGGLLSTIKYAVPAALLFGTISGLKESVEEAQKLQLLFAQLAEQADSLGKTGDLPQLKNSIMGIAAESGTAASEVANLAFQFQGAFGGDTQTTIKETEAAVKAVKITGLSLKETTDAFTAITGSFKNPTTSIEKITDTALGLQERFGVLAKETIAFAADLAPVGAQIGLTAEKIETLGAVSQKYSGKGGAAIAENFNRALPELQKNATKVIGLFADIGQEDIAQKLADDLGAGKTGLAFETLIKNFKNLGKVQQNYVIEQLGGPKVSAALIGILEHGDEYFESLKKGPQDAGKEAKYYAQVLDTISSKMDILKERLIQLGGGLFTGGLGEALKVLVGAGTAIAESFGIAFGVLLKVNDVMHGLPFTILSLVGALKAMVVIYGIASTAIGKFTKDKATETGVTNANTGADSANAAGKKRGMIGQALTAGKTFGTRVGQEYQAGAIRPDMGQGGEVGRIGGGLRAPAFGAAAAATAQVTATKAAVETTTKAASEAAAIQVSTAAAARTARIAAETAANTATVAAGTSAAGITEAASVKAAATSNAAAVTAGEARVAAEAAAAQKTTAAANAAAAVRVESEILASKANVFSRSLASAASGVGAFARSLPTPLVLLGAGYAVIQLVKTIQDIRAAAEKSVQKIEASFLTKSGPEQEQRLQLLRNMEVTWKDSITSWITGNPTPDDLAGRLDASRKAGGYKGRAEFGAQLAEGRFGDVPLGGIKAGDIVGFGSKGNQTRLKELKDIIKENPSDKEAQEELDRIITKILDSETVIDGKTLKVGDIKTDDGTSLYDYNKKVYDDAQKLVDAERDASKNAAKSKEELEGQYKALDTDLGVITGKVDSGEISVGEGLAAINRNITNYERLKKENPQGIAPNDKEQLDKFAAAKANMVSKAILGAAEEGNKLLEILGGGTTGGPEQRVTNLTAALRSGELNKADKKKGTDDLISAYKDLYDFRLEAANSLEEELKIITEGIEIAPEAQIGVIRSQLDTSIKFIRYAASQSDFISNAITEGSDIIAELIQTQGLSVKAATVAMLRGKVHEEEANLVALREKRKAAKTFSDIFATDKAIDEAEDRRGKYESGANELESGAVDLGEVTIPGAYNPNDAAEIAKEVNRATRETNEAKRTYAKSLHRGDSVLAAQLTLDTDKEILDSLVVNSKEWLIQAAKVEDDKNALKDALQTREDGKAAFNKALLSGDTVAIARIDVQIAEKELAESTPDNYDQNRANLVNARNAEIQTVKGLNNARSSYFQQLNSDDPLNAAREGLKSAEDDLALEKAGTVGWYNAATKVNSQQKAVRDAIGSHNQAVLSYYKQFFSDDPIKVAQLGVQAAQETLSRATVGTDAWYAALSGLDAAQKSERDAIEALDRAKLDFAAVLVSGDAIKSAELARKRAQYDLAHAHTQAAKLTALAAQISADRQFEQANQALMDAKSAVLNAQSNYIGETVAVANQGMADALRNLAYVESQFKRGEKGEADVLNAKAAVRNAAGTQRDTIIQKKQDDYDFQLAMGQITKSQYISYLEGLKSLADGNQQIIRDLDLKIKGLKQDMAQDLQWNLPTNLGLPTLYAVRRLDQTPAGPNGQAGGYTDQRQIKIDIVVNDGADLDQVKSILTDALGSNRMSTSRRY